MGSRGKIGHRARKGGDEGPRRGREGAQSQVVHTVWQLRDERVEGHPLRAGRAGCGEILNAFFVVLTH